MDGLLSNVVGGVLAALAFAGIVWLKDRRKHRILKELTEIMGEAIKHRNIGEKGPPNTAEWVKEAGRIERKAIRKAGELSSTAGALVEWLDRVEPYPRGSKKKQYISILNKVIERIRELMERNS